MVRVLVWKELREQWISAAAVVAFGVCLFLVALASNSAFYYTAGAMVVSLAWVCGVVAGVQPLATEYESGTLGWLDELPVTRRRLWFVKSSSAAAVVLVQVTLLIGLGFLLGIHDPKAIWIVHALFAFAWALGGLACGLLGSALARTTLGAFGWALALQGALLLVGLLLGSVSSTIIGDVAASIIFLGLTLFAPLILSIRLFSRLDRLRRSVDVVEQSTSGRGWRSLLWLTWRQSRLMWWGIMLAGVLAAVVAISVPHCWPGIGLILALIAGIGSFGVDHHGAAYRFLGTQRLPPGRLWLVKTLVLASALAAVLAAYWLIGYSRIKAVELNAMRNNNWVTIQRMWNDYDASLVLLGPVFGFALGQFFGLVCRKGVIALVSALFACSAVLIAWLPSLVFGGVHLWQWLGPPLLLVATTRLIVWPWISGRLVSVKPILGIVAAILLAGAGVVAGVGYRIAEVPVHTDPFDVAAFEASLPTPEQNVGGRAIVRAVRDFHDHCKVVSGKLDPGVAVLGNGVPNYHLVLVNDILTKGEWSDDPKLTPWLNAVMEGGWLDELVKGTKAPPGRIAFGGYTYATLDYMMLNTCTTAGRLILARALQRMARGELEPAWDDFALALQLSRHLQNKANGGQFLQALQIENEALRIVANWGEKAIGQPEQLRRAIEYLRVYDSAGPPLSDVIKVDYLMALDYAHHPFRPQPDVNRIEEALADAARNVPWEQSRIHDIQATLCVGLLRTAESDYPNALGRIASANVGPREQNYFLYAWMPPAGDDGSAHRAAQQLRNLVFTSIWSNGPMYGGPYLFAHEARARVLCRASQIQLALLLCQARHGKPAESLETLVPDILPSLPNDPFGDGPFHYRISAGEKLHWDRHGSDEPAYRMVPTGTAVLWSVGPDLQDDGGRLNDPATWRYPHWEPGADILFLIPRVPIP